jgi:hypothetical protein
MNEFLQYNVSLTFYDILHIAKLFYAGIGFVFLWLFKPARNAIVYLLRTYVLVIILLGFLSLYLFINNSLLLIIPFVLILIVSITVFLFRKSLIKQINSISNTFKQHNYAFIAAFIWSLIQTWTFSKSLLSAMIDSSSLLKITFTILDYSLLPVIFVGAFFLSLHMFVFIFRNCYGIDYSWDFNKRDYSLLFIILLPALIIRIIGIDFGKPFLVHPDEFLIVSNAAKMVIRGDLMPHYFNRPDHVLIWLNSIVLSLASFLRYLKPLTETFENNTFYFYIVSRFINVLIGLLVSVFAYKIGKRFSTTAAVLSALLFAFSPTLVKHSQYVAPDVIMVLFLLLVIDMTIEYLDSENSVWLYLAASVCAIATTEKYTGLIYTFIIAAVVIWKSKNVLSLIKNGFSLLTQYGFTLFLAAPTIFYLFNRTYKAFRIESHPNRLGSDGLGYIGNLRYYLDVSLSNFGAFVIIISLISLLYLLYKKKFNTLPVLFSLSYYLLLSYMAVHRERWGTPMLVFPVLFAAIGAGEFFKYKFLKIPLVLLFTLSLSSAFLSSLSSSMYHSLPDTRSISYQFTEAEGINYSNSFYNRYTPLYPGNQFFNSTIKKPRRFKLEVEELRKYKYAVLSTYQFDRIYKNREKVPHLFNIYEYLRNGDEWEMIAEYTSIDEYVPKNNAFINIKTAFEYISGLLSGKHYSGPVIEIYINIKFTN